MSRGKLLYSSSAALVLALTALAKLYSAAGEARVLGLWDPLLPFTQREVLLGAGLVELAVAAYVLWGRSALAKHLWVLWLSGNFVLYRLGLWWVAPGRPCRCLGTVTERLPGPPAVVDGALKGVIAYLLVGSLWGLAQCWRAGRKEAERLRSAAAARGQPGPSRAGGAAAGAGLRVDTAAGAGLATLPERCVAVVMPCYNEAGTVEEMLRRVLAQPVVAEVIVVDDGSTDGTWERVQPWPARDARVRLVRHEVNRGKGAAVRTALGLATAPAVVVQDADLEYDPADYGRLVEPIRAGQAQVVYGTRFGPGSRAQTPWWRRWRNRFLTAVANWLTGLRLTDEATCYKMFGCELALALELREDGFGFCPELTAKLARHGVLIVEVPIGYRGRSRAEGKKLRLRHGLEALRCLWKYS